MWLLSFENGMETSSLCAELALRTRVNMSAIGSVIVIGLLRPLSPRFPPSNTRRTCAVDGLGRYGCRGLRRGGYVRPGWAGLPGESPAGLGHTRELATVGHLPQADPAQAELAVDRVRTAAALAAGVAADRELRLLVRLVDKGSLGHAQFSLNGKPSALSSARPSASFVAVVTTVMSMPRTRSILSWSISWNMTCSVRPKV